MLRDVPPSASAINPQAPPELAQIVARCLEKRPEDRYQTMREVCVLLEDLKTGSQSGRVTLPPNAGKRLPVRPGLKRAAIAAAALTAASALLWISFGRRTAAPAREYTLTRLTQDGGLAVTPAISADGRLLAYASDRAEGNLDIWVRQISGGDALRLTRDPADESEPSFSPDGGRIAFSSLRNGGGIYTISSLGGDLRFVAADGQRPRFSPDGKSIVYWVRDRLTNWGKVYVVPATGGTPRQIVPEFPDARWPVWSPDGAALLFDGSPGHDSLGDWWIAPFAGGASPVQTGARDVFQSNGMEARPEPGDWRGDAVIFAAQKGETNNLWRLPVSPRNFRTDGNLQRLTAGSSTDSAPAVSPAGAVVFATGTQGRDLWVRPLDSTGEKFTGPMERLPSGGAPNHENPTVSKDGRICAFGDTRELWIRDMNTGRESRLTNFAEAEPPIGGKPVTASTPVISPEGDRVAFRKLAGPARSLWTIPATGGAAAQLTDVCGSPIEWLPGGRFLLLRSCDRLQKLGLLDTQTKNLVTLIDSPKWSVRNAAISPDAHTLVIGAVSKQPHSVIFLAPWSGGSAIPESQWTAVTAESEDAHRPVWAPVGGMLYFSIGEVSGFYGQRVDRAGRPAGPHVKVQEFGSRYRAEENGRIAAVPGRLIFSLRETLSEIWMGRPEN